MCREDDILGDRHLHVGVQVGLRTADRSGVGPQFDDIELALGRCREADIRFVL